MNKIKDNKGITLLTLVITVIVLAIIAATAISISVNLTASAKFENVETTLLLIQNKCKIKAEKYAIKEIEEDELYGTKQEGGTYDGWYLLSQGDLIEIGIKGIKDAKKADEEMKEEDKYYVNYENDDVAYGKGIKYEGQEFHYLSEMLDYTRH